jgi:hypothetical protein
VSHVRNWLASEAGIKADGPSRILSAYGDFQGWNYARQLANGWSDNDIQNYPTKELLAFMEEWVAAGRPVSTDHEAEPFDHFSMLRYLLAQVILLAPWRAAWVVDYSSR